MRMRAFMLALLAGTVISGPGAALEPSGTAVGVDPDAEAGGTGGLRIVEIKGPIFMGDTITTSTNGRVQIEFIDDTKFVVGANSKVMIDAFVFDANQTAQKVTITAVKGAFRFITGNSPKQNYAIRTPTMTIGVRGTAFDLAVRPGSGESTVVTHDGNTDVCDAIRRCMEGNPGSMIVGARGADLKSVPAGLERDQRLRAFFPLIASQLGLATGFQVNIMPDVQITTGSTGTPIHSTTGDPPSPPPPPPSEPPPDGRHR